MAIEELEVVKRPQTEETAARGWFRAIVERLLVPLRRGKRPVEIIEGTQQIFDQVLAGVLPFRLDIPQQPLARVLEVRQAQLVVVQVLLGGGHLRAQGFDLGGLGRRRFGFRLRGVGHCGVSLG